MPQSWSSPVVAYHLACPRCGYSNSVLRGHRGQVISEKGRDVTLDSPVRCLYCRVLIHLRHGEFKLEEDGDVRKIAADPSRS